MSCAEGFLVHSCLRFRNFFCIRFRRLTPAADFIYRCAMAGTTSTLHLLKEEFVQRTDEGCEIPPALRRLYEALDQNEDRWKTELAEPIYDALMRLPEDVELAAREPNDWEGIQALLPESPPSPGWKPDERSLRDKLHGAWVGRATGCALGKPVEGRCLQRDEDDRLSGRRSLREYLEKRGDWPLRDFISNRDIGDGDTIPPFQSYRENIAFMESDDDIFYTLVGLRVLEKYGRDFDWMQIGRTWFEHIPVSALCTAEINAATNLLARSACGREGDATPQWCRRHRNPYREWIGAQIRADAWGYAAAGNPALAAELAWRDAHWTHERNGIYGEMFFAAVIAAAFVESDFSRLVETGLARIPAECRLAGWIRRCLEWLETCANWEEAMDRLESELGQMHVVHTINNALIVLIALYYGGGELDRTTCIAVMCGLDTDCNGATAGSIIGAIRGHDKLDSHLSPRLNDTAKVKMIGFEEITFTELADRHAAVWKALA